VKRGTRTPGRVHHYHEKAAVPAPRAKDKDLIGGALLFSSGLFGEIEKK
jgi:hypothetical protein